MNQVTLIGRLTKDPELKYTTQNGKAFCKFSLAVTQEFNREKADYINCVAWEKRAETIAQYLRSGNRLAIQGRLSVRDYEQNGEKRWITEVIVDKFEFLETKGGQSSSYTQPKETKNVSEKFEDIQVDDIDTIDDDDFPF